MALSGTGYAATQLSKASVGAKHLKKNAVSSAKVKDSSLLVGDFKLSERSKLRGGAGARGAAGARGSQGLRGGLGLQGTAGGQGTDGTDGTDGDAGLDGAQGMQGATGVEEVVVRTAALTFTSGVGPNGQTLSDDAQCQTGESVVGGGTDTDPLVAVLDQPNVIITSNRPADAGGSALPAGGEPRGWFATARRNSNTATQTVIIYVLCASAGS